tara:strand:+ start:29 stop:286 length:258 start_codon:yes stop_codon:yes gene_type:complete
MDDQEITHEDESGQEAFKFTQRGYMWLNPIKLNWNYCNPAFSLRSIADIKELVELRKTNEDLHQKLIDQAHDHELEMKDFKWFGE